MEMTVPISRWEEVFWTLATRRAAVFWSEAGLPVSLSRRPEPALAAARGFLARVREDVIAEGPAATDAARIALGQIDDAYGSADGGEVRIWTDRYFLAPDRMKWGRWSQLIGMLARADGPEVPLHTTISPAHYAAITALARERYGTTERPDLNELETRARAIPLSGEEIDVLTIDAGSRGPEDPELFDTVTHAFVVASTHRAYTFWREVHALGDRELAEQLVGWGKREAARIHLDPDAVEFPL